MNPHSHRSSDGAPSIYPDAVPAEEQELVWLIITRLHSLNRRVDEFKKSLALFRHSTALLEEAYAQRPPSEKMSEWTREQGERFEKQNEAMDLYREWCMIAARGSALVVYDFGRDRDGLHEMLGQSKMLLGWMDNAKLKSASRLFENLLGFYIHLRHGISHVGDKGRNPKQFTKHVITDRAVAEQYNKVGGGARFSTRRGSFAFGSDPHALVDMQLEDDLFSTGWGGKLYSIEINDETVVAMVKVRDAYYDAFDSVSVASYDARTELWAKRAAEKPNG
jgi:hypothetical protein